MTDDPRIRDFADRTMAQADQGMAAIDAETVELTRQLNLAALALYRVLRGRGISPEYAAAIVLSQPIGHLMLLTDEER